MTCSAFFFFLEFLQKELVTLDKLLLLINASCCHLPSLTEVLQNAQAAEKAKKVNIMKCLISVTVMDRNRKWTYTGNG